MVKLWRQWLKRAAIVLGAVMGVAALFIAEEHIRGRLELSALKRELLARGEKLAPDELAPILPPAGIENGKQLAAAEKELEALGREILLVTDSPVAMKLVSPGFARVMFREPALEYGFKAPASTSTHTWDELRRQLELCEGALDKAAVALSAPVTFHIDYDKGAEASLMGPNVMRLVTTLRAEILSRLNAGNLPAAIEALELLGSSWRVHEYEHLLVPQVISVGCAAFSTDVVWEALQAEGWNEDQLERIQRSFTIPNYIGRFADAIEMERALQSIIFEQLRESSAGRAALLRMLDVNFVRLFADDDYDPSVPWELEIWLRSNLWRAAWSHQDEARTLRTFSEVIDQVEALHRDQSWIGSPLRERQKNKPATELDQWRFLFSEAMPADVVANSIVSAVKQQTRCELLRAAIALKRYRLRHGKFPGVLSELVPNYLPAVPLDWMDGNPLRYRPEGDETFVLYSVGLNGKDDGGDPEMPADAKRISLDGLDTVWPRPATEQHEPPTLKPIE